MSRNRKQWKNRAFPLTLKRGHSRGTKYALALFRCIGAISMHWRYFDIFVLLCPDLLRHQGTSPERDNPLEPANQNRSAEEGAP